VFRYKQTDQVSHINMVGPLMSTKLRELGDSRILLSTHDLQRAGKLRTLLENLSYQVELVTPSEDISSSNHFELLIVTGSASSRSALLLKSQADSLFGSPSFALIDTSDFGADSLRGYQEVFQHGSSLDDVVAVARSLIERKKLQISAGIVGETDAMQQVLGRVVQFAPVSSTVLVTGESGTGKELIARGLHQLSPRRHNPFIAVNVAALTDTLLESELFGHQKGAFTGAIDSRRGLFELADKGTVFLDEIGEMPLSTQTKLLRVLEQKEFNRVGGEEVIQVDVRIVTATNLDLKQSVALGRFRKDLYYRLNVLRIELPALCDRKEDIPLLVESFIEEFTRRHNRTFQGISSEAMEILKEYHWPGNVRELNNLIESMVVLAPGREVSPRDIPEEVRSGRRSSSAVVPLELVSSDILEQSTEKTIRPELEFVFRTLVELRMDVDDLRTEFRAYKNRGDEGVGSIPIDSESHGLEGGRIEVGVRTSEGLSETVWETHGDEVMQPSVVYSSGMTLEELERKAIAATLLEFKGNRRKAAQSLEIGERTLYRKIKAYEL
jgi:transcriptional regulator with PAS, ATPase and Fis domain